MVGALEGKGYSSVAKLAFGNDAGQFGRHADTCCAIDCDEPSIISAGATPMCKTHLIEAYSAIGEFLRSQQEEPDTDAWLEEWLKTWEPVPPSLDCPNCGLLLVRNRETGEVFCADTKHCYWWNTAEEFAEWATRVLKVENETDEVVYYVRFGDRVKIGTSKDLSKRLSHIPHDEVMATEPGGVYVERQRHKQFKHLRAEVGRGREWFTLTPELAEHIAAVKARMVTAA